MPDLNQNGVPDGDEATFHVKSLVVGGLAGIVGGGVLLSVLAWAIPSFAGFLAVWAGSVCSPYQDSLGKYKQAWACIEGAADAVGAEIGLCAEKLEN